jgi:fibronectin type 3 domain-containing protein
MAPIRSTPIRFIPLLVGLTVVAALCGHAALPRVKTPGRKEPMRAAYAKLPLAFEANQGQADPQVQFLSQGSGYTLWLTGKEAVLGLRKPEDGRVTAEGGSLPRPSILRMRLLGSDPNSKGRGAEPLSGQVDYFFGNDPRKWRTNVPTYGKVKYAGVYPGVDLVYYGNQDQLEYDFVVKPGANPHQIRLAYSGAAGVDVAANGDLLLHTEGGDVRQRKPVIYQEVDGQRTPVQGDYVLLSHGHSAKRKAGDVQALDSNTHQVGFKLAKYDATRPLIIDPVLTYGTYLAGSSVDDGHGIAVDKDGMIYVVGTTLFNGFPQTSGAYQGPQGNNDAFVVKLDPAKSGAASLLYATHLGGSSGDLGNAIAVDGDGMIYVAGTASYDFPTTPNSFYPRQRIAGDGFLVKLDPTKSGAASLVYSTYLGGAAPGIGHSIALDADRNVYITGGTGDRYFTPTPGAFQTDQPLTDAFLLKLDLTRTGADALLYSTYLGGSGDDSGSGVALDSTGHVYITGTTESANFPTTPGGFQTEQAGKDAFMVELDLSQSGAASLLYGTYLGGFGDDLGEGIAVDGNGAVYVTGQAGPSFPVTAGAYQTTLRGSDAYLVKLDPTQSGAASLLYSTYLGGNGGDNGSGIALDAAGYVYLAGWTQSSDFPTTPGALPPAPRAPDQLPSDGFVAKLDLNRSGAASLLYSTYLGGSSLDGAYDIAVDALGNACVMGNTQSRDFPTTPSGYNPGPGNGSEHAFVVRLSAISPAAPSTPTVTPVSETELDLSWTHPGTNASRFEVYHRPQGGSYSLVAKVASTVRTFQDTGLAPGTGYTYFVRAVSSEEGYTDSPEAGGVTLPLPAPPTRLQAALSGAVVHLSWEESDARAKEFHLERKSDTEAYRETAVLGAAIRTYSDDSVGPSTHYVYRVRAFGTAAFSDYSIEAEITTPPGTPTGLTAEPFSATQARLTWKPGNGPAPYQYRIERKSGGGSFQEVGRARGNSPAFLDAGLTPNTLYTYRVRAAGVNTVSDYSNTPDVTTPAAPEAPTALSAQAVSATQVLLTFTPGGGPVSYFRIERLFRGNWVEIGRAKAAETSFMEGQLAPGTAYRYRVRAVNGASVSAPSPEAEATTGTVPGAPPTLTARALSGGRIQLVWTAGPGTPTAYQVERRSGSVWIEVGRTRPNALGFIDTGRTAGAEYTYLVRALSGTARSAPSPAASAVALP